jgi:hypothetical protein
MFKRFLKSWRFVRDLRYNELAGELPWSLDDQENLNRFMLSPTGVKFRGRLANFAITKALESVAVSEDPLYHAGTAYGVQITNLYVDQHLPMSEEEETEESLNGELSGIYG